MTDIFSDFKYYFMQFYRYMYVNFIRNQQIPSAASRFWHNNKPPQSSKNNEQHFLLNLNNDADDDDDSINSD